MKIVIFEKRQYEDKVINEYKQKDNIEIITTQDIIEEKTLNLIEGADAISILGYSALTPQLLEKVKKSGVKHISTRTIGFNHIDVKYAKSIGLNVSNVTYAPNGVADFTVMLMLMAIRNYKPAMWRQNVNDYTLNGLMGKEMRHLTVGVLGTGRIGSTVIKNLSGFGCQILAYDIYQNESVKNIAAYTSLDNLLHNSDIITIHMPYNDSNKYFINKSTISKMKDGIILVNTARADLMNISDLIEGIETEKIGALALDVFQNEDEIYHHAFSTDIIRNRDMAYLRQFPNVILTQHMAFFTDSAVNEMISNSLNNLITFYNTGKCNNIL